MKKTTLLQLQIKKAFLEKFKNMSYYSPLPGERDLCQMFQVSRPTIRKVLENLEEEKLITKIQGKGSFYLGNKVPIDYSDALGHGLGLSSVLSLAGKFTRSHVLQQDIELPHPEIAAYLNIDRNDMVFHLKRLRYVNDELYNLADDYIPLKICPGLMDVDFTNNSLMKTMEENSIIPCKEDKNIEIGKADIKEAAYLNLNESDPISITRIITYDKDSNIIQFAMSKADAYKSRFRILSSIK